MQSHLSACPSPVHRAVLGLLPVAFGHDPAPGLEQDLRDSDPVELADATQAEFVQTVMAAAFDVAPNLRSCIPEDLLLFFQEIRRGNVEYNGLARGDLARVGAILNAGGLHGCVVKGGAELLAPSWSDPAGRFISDLDILVEVPGRQHLERLLDAGVTGLLKEPENRDLTPDEKHFPAFQFPNGHIGIELHTRLVRGSAERLLPASEALGGATASALPGIRVPDLRTRMIHHVLHTQVDNHSHELFEVKPRSIVDHAMFQRQLSDQERDEIRTAFVRHGFGKEYDALDAVTGLVFDKTAPRADQAAWAEHALALYGQPKRRKSLNQRRFVIALISRAIFNRESRRHYVSLLLSPRRLKQAWKDNIGRIRQRSR
ncbi:nucleotidyltransferase family protein [Antarctobacter jejuensis]|uniref:nucleotidyltransferase family protein n=1 Tax=Antarctobacter jejuensis TaxID=1439938 RepID=UPI003FD2A694